MIYKDRNLELEAVNRPHGLVVTKAMMDGVPVELKIEVTISNLLAAISRAHALKENVPQVFVTIGSIDCIDPLLNLIAVNVDGNKLVIVRTEVPSVHAECRHRIESRHLKVVLRKYMPAE